MVPVSALATPVRVSCSGLWCSQAGQSLGSPLGLTICAGLTPFTCSAVAAPRQSWQVPRCHGRMFLWLLLASYDSVSSKNL